MEYLLIFNIFPMPIESLTPKFSVKKGNIEM